MNSEYLIVHKKLLPPEVEKAIKARKMLALGQVASITEAVGRVGISRNTYYKYRDCVFEPQDGSPASRAVISLVLRHVGGALSEVIATLSACGTSILTISQAIPIAGLADVLISLDITRMDCSLDALVQRITALDCVADVRSCGVE